jgi:hypothetical protein
MATRRSPLEAARAAGTLVPGRREQPGLVAGVATHLAVSLFWGALIRLGVRRVRRHRLLFGAAAGAGIAALDLGLIARCYPALEALPQAPQWADHIVFGAIVAAAKP